LPTRREEWEKVRVAPELRRSTVFRSGSEKGKTGVIPDGGQAEPNSTLGEREQWR